jgi:WD40 repeat protein
MTSRRNPGKPGSKGIIQVEKDTLVFCVVNPKQELPKDFKPAAGNGFVVTMVRFKEGEAEPTPEKPAGPISFKHNGFIYGVAFSPDGKTLVAGSYAVVKRWDVPSGKAYPDLAAHTQPVETVAASPNGKFLVSASGFAGQDVKLWDRDGKLLASLKHGAAYAAFSPDSKVVATGASDQTVKLWETATGRELATLNVAADSVMALAYSLDGKTLAVGNRDKSIRLWDPKAEKEIATLEGHPGFVCKLAYSPDGKILASGSWDGTVKLWDVTTQRVVKSIALEKGIVKGVAFTNDGKVFATASGGGVIKLWDPVSWRELGSLPPLPGLMSVAISPDGKRLAAGIGLSPESGEVKIWDIAEILKRESSAKPTAKE